MITVSNIQKKYGELEAVSDISIQVDDGEFATIVGPSGCGKTTLLRMIAGHQTPTSGTVENRGIGITNESPQNRPTCLVFQDGALFPHMSVRENVEYPIKLRGEEPNGMVNELFQTVHLDPDEHGDKPPSELSGGQQQRVALARSLAYEPDVLLLDEPLGSLDYVLQKQLQRELSNLNQELGITFIYVTHSLEAALAMSDKLFVMDDGNIVQVGTPEDIYLEPNSKFIAEFMGDCNTIEIETRGRSDGKMKVTSTEFEEEIAVPSRKDTNVSLTHLVIRQDNCRIEPNLSNEFGIPVTVKNTLPQGNTAIIEGVSLTTEKEYVAEMELESIRQSGIKIGSDGYLQWNKEQSVLVPEGN